jgi:transposase-like protein
LLGAASRPEVIVLAVRWKLRFGRSDREVEELLAERGIEVDHLTVDRGVVRCTPPLAAAARPCRHQAGGRWQADQTSVKVAGRWRASHRSAGHHRIEADHGRPKTRSRPLGGLHQDHSAR